MKLGDEPVEQIEAIPSGSLTLDLALGVQGYPKEELLKSTDLNHLVKLLLLFTLLLNAKSKAEFAHLLMRSTRLTSTTLNL